MLHHMFNSKDLAKRTISHNILKDGAHKIARNCGYDGRQRTLANMFYKSFDQKTRPGVSVNETLAEELHKLVVKRFKRKKVYARFKDNIWAADLLEMRSLSSKNQNVKYLLFVIDVFTKYAWVKPLKVNKSKTVLNVFIKIVNESNR